MKRSLEKTLDARRSQIRARWMEILFVEPVNTPLANPNTLIFLIDGTIEAVLTALRRNDLAVPIEAPTCACGKNPFLSYFRAGTQALLETLVFVFAETPALHPDERDAAFTELSAAIGRVALREIKNFGSLCEANQTEPITVRKARCGGRSDRSRANISLL